MGDPLGQLSEEDLRDLAKLGIRYDDLAANLISTPVTSEVSRESTWRMCAQDPEFFVIDSRLVKTLDNRKKWDCVACQAITPSVARPACGKCGAETTLRDPIQPFPIHRYGPRFVLRLLQREPLISLAKSRRLMATELICAYALHCLMFRKGTLAVFQSDKEDKANDNVIRVHGMWDRLPEWMKKRRPANPSRSGGMIEGYFEMPNNHGKLKAIPSGPKQIREMGPSLYFCDEAAFHAEATETYSAVSEAIEAGCQAVYVSTAGAGFFAGLHNDSLHMVA